MTYEEKETEVTCPVCDTVNKVTGMGNCSECKTALLGT